MKKLTSEEFYSALRSNEYGQQYLELIEKVQSENRKVKRTQDGCELHHIQPRALSGSNKKDNLIKLTLFEHCQAHILLAKAIPCGETLITLIMFSNGRIQTLQDLEKIELETVYGWAEMRQKGIELHTGWHHTLEARQKMSRDRKGRAAWNKGKRNKRLSEVTKGKVYVYSPEGVRHRVYPNEIEKYLQQGFTRENKVYVHKGEDCERKILKRDLEKYLADGFVKGRLPKYFRLAGTYHHSKETKEKLSKINTGKKLSEQTKEKMIKSRTGKTTAWKDGRFIRVRTEELADYLDKGYFKTKAESIATVS